MARFSSVYLLYYYFLMPKLSKKIYQYTAIFEYNEDGGYTVTVPALPGLVSEGDNLEKAERMAEDAIRSYLEGLRKDKLTIPSESISMSPFRKDVSISLRKR